ncbi:MAG: hypothetical protein KF866_07335 [Phycisphaeraceae bacterium]|nr:hypothetical protein [Phycisphaeraceae bacterium]
MKPANVLVLLLAIAIGTVAAVVSMRSVWKDAERLAFHGRPGMGAFGGGNYQWMSDDQLEALVARTPENGLAMVQFARRVESRGEIDRARQLYKSGLEKIERWIHEAGGRGDVKENWYHKGLALRGLGLEREATSAFHRSFAFQRVLCERLLEDPRERLRAEEFYNLACFGALAGLEDEALDALDRAIAFGFSRLDLLQRDMDLDALREHPRFIAMLARVVGVPALADGDPSP